MGARLSEDQWPERHLSARKSEHKMIHAILIKDGMCQLLPVISWLYKNEPIALLSECPNCMLCSNIVWRSEI